MGGIVAYSYDAIGNVITKTDKDKSVTQYAYTPNSQLSKITYADSREAMLSYNPLSAMLVDFEGIKYL